MIACFGPAFFHPDQERAARLMEENIELFHAQGKSFEDLVALARRVYSRPPGDPQRELGDVMVTLAALAEVNGHDMVSAGEEALARNWDRVAAIREKQASKPVNTVLPGLREPENNWVPSEGQTASACISYRHDFGLLSPEERRMVMFEAREWLRAWLREMPKTPALRHVETPEQYVG
jgi:NTP pyrophosphatase (non-canonical NTP hydrolase)